MSCCLWHDLFQGIVERMTNELTALVSSTMSSRWLLRFGMSTSSQTETSSLSALNVSFTWKYCSSQMSLVREWNPRHFSPVQHKGRHLHPQGLVRHESRRIKPQMDRFVFPDVHRVIVVASGRLLKPLAIRFPRCCVPSRSKYWRCLIY